MRRPSIVAGRRCFHSMLRRFQEMNQVPIDYWIWLKYNEIIILYWKRSRHQKLSSGLTLNFGGRTPTQSRCSHNFVSRNRWNGAENGIILELFRCRGMWLRFIDWENCFEVLEQFSINKNNYSTQPYNTCLIPRMGFYNYFQLNCLYIHFLHQLIILCIIFIETAKFISSASWIN